MTEPRLNVLVAYPYMSQQVVEGLSKLGPELRFVLDSGAFTAWKAGKPIELDDYCRFLDGLQVRPDALARANEIKMPVANQQDIDNLVELLGPNTEGKTVWLQPVSQGDEATQLCMDTCSLHRWRLSLQTDKYAGLR